MTSYTVSAIIPTYNSALFIDRAVQSALNQTSPLYEIILVDDCSTDNTVEVLTKNYAHMDRVRILTTSRNSGPGTARNIGLRESSGNYVGLLDADDAWTLDRNKRFQDILSVSDLDFLADNFLLYDGYTDEIVGPGFKPDFVEKEIGIADLFLNDIVIHEKFNYGLLQPYMKSSFLRNSNLNYDESQRYGEDFKLYAEMLFNGAKAKLVSTPGYICTLRHSPRKKIKSDKSQSIPRFDKLYEVSLELREKYAAEISPDIDKAMRKRERSLLVVHQANEAKLLRISKDIRGYVAYVIVRPRLIGLLIYRQLRIILKLLTILR